jgi:long-subunit fatty acid transport protein
VQANRDELILDNFTLNEDIDVRGTGINLTAGIIYKPNDVIRFGASIVTPTWYSLSDRYTPRVQAIYEYPQYFGPNVNREQNKSIEDLEAFEYNLTTPFSVSGGMSLFAGKNGFITADVTYSTYNTIRLDSDVDNFEGENNFISRNYQPTINTRLGGEFRKDIFRLRAGAGYQTDPYKDMADNLDRARLNFSAGAGVRLPDFYIDLAVVHSRYNSGYTPYTISNQATPSVTVKNRLTNAVLSFGMFF